MCQRLDVCCVAVTREAHPRGPSLWWRGSPKDHVQQDSQLSPKREIALSAVPRYWELELMLLPSIKYDFTILRGVIMTLILKTIHTSHQKNQKNKY